MNGKNRKLGDLLVETNMITSEQLRSALDIQRITNKKLGQILIDEGMLSENQFIEVLELQLGIPRAALDKYPIEPETARLISERLARRHEMIPLRLEDGKIIIAMTDPMNIFAFDDVKLATGHDVIPVIASRSDIMAAIDSHYQQASAELVMEEFQEAYEGIEESLEDEDVLKQINNAPVVKLVNSIITQAVKMRASDIHIEPFEKIVRVRYRVDGELQEHMTPSKSSQLAISARIKIMGKMNIAERRAPQDGRIEMNVEGQDIDMRISVFPGVYGEKIVIRLLDRSGTVMTKQDLGFTGSNGERFEGIIKNPYGMILVTGPTGSGKTTTLYAVLKELNQVGKNIITIEDPAEYRLFGVNQSQINPKAGLTFASGLRSILRQDPDIIMVGEIRDMETAQIAVRAAITGHLVLSTVHTNDTVSTIARMMDMGVEAFMLSSSLVGVVAQRLVKVICSHCKESYPSNEMESRLMGIPLNTTLYRGHGCNACGHTGYRGRTAIQEVLPITKRIKTLIDTQQSSDALRQAAMAEGMTTLRQSCMEHVLSGTTTTEEMIRMTYHLD